MADQPAGVGLPGERHRPGGEPQRGDDPLIQYGPERGAEGGADGGAQEPEPAAERLRISWRRPENESYCWNAAITFHARKTTGIPAL